jgi:hypothetical protein
MEQNLIGNHIFFFFFFNIYLCRGVVERMHKKIVDTSDFRSSEPVPPLADKGLTDTCSVLVFNATQKSL